MRGQPRPCAHEGWRADQARILPPNRGVLSGGLRAGLVHGTCRPLQACENRARVDDRNMRRTHRGRARRDFSASQVQRIRRRSCSAGVVPPALPAAFAQWRAPECPWLPRCRCVCSGSASALPLHDDGQSVAADCFSSMISQCRNNDILTSPCLPAFEPLHRQPVRELRALTCHQNHIKLSRAGHIRQLQWPGDSSS